MVIGKSKSVCGYNKIQAIASEGLKLEHGLTTSIKGILTCLVSYKPSVDVAVCSGLRSSDDQITCSIVLMFRCSDGQIQSHPGQSRSLDPGLHINTKLIK